MHRMTLGNFGFDRTYQNKIKHVNGNKRNLDNHFLIYESFIQS